MCWLDLFLFNVLYFVIIYLSMNLIFVLKYEIVDVMDKRDNLFNVNIKFVC